MNTNLVALQRGLGHWRVALSAAMMVISIPILTFQTVNASACTTPSVDYGRVSSSITAPGAGTYRIWTRMYVPSTTNSTYLLELDGNTCFNVGGSGVAANAWTWVAHQNGSTSSRTDSALSQGAHAVKLIGNKPGVKIDRVIISSDLNCVPTGFGDNCKPQTDSTPPAVMITAPIGTVKGSQTTITANVADANGVLKSDFYIDGVFLASDSSAPYSAVWDTTRVSNGTHQLAVRAYDNAGNMGTDTDTVTVSNGDTQAPSAPSNVTAQAVSATKAKVSWTAGKDNVLVTGYMLYRNDVPVSTLGAVTSYEDSGLNPNTTYTYKLSSRDAAGNVSPVSSSATVKTPVLAQPDTQAPGAPRSVAANAISQSQINLTWTAATDNVGVSGYDIFRIRSGSTAAQKIGSTQATSYGDTGLESSTKYSYYIVARDAAGNVSGHSQTVDATTQAKPSTNPGIFTVTGTVRDAQGKGIRYAWIRSTVGNVTYIFRTNQQGAYRVWYVPTGTYNVIAQKRGYDSSRQTISVTNSNVVKDFTLTKLNGNR